MQTLTEHVYRLDPPGGIFDDTVVRNLFPKASAGARKLLIYRAVHNGGIIRIKPGVYCLTEAYRRPHPHPFVVAALLHSPSHISLESALSHHGLIPEAVHQISSVTIRRSREFLTPLGIFTFQRVPAANPRAGVNLEKVDEYGWAFVASPLRSIADLIYLRKHISWGKDGSRFLTVSMRIEEGDLRAMQLEDFGEICQSIGNKRTRTYLNGLKTEIGR